MIRPSFIDMLQSFIGVVESSGILILVLFIFTLLSIHLYKTIEINIEKAKKQCIFFFLFLFLFLLFLFHDFILKAINFIIQQIFITICFPSILVYIGMLILINFVTFTSLFKKEIPKIMKGIHIFTYVIFHFISILLVYIIITENIDSSSILNMYTNQNILNIVELSICIFTFWIIVVIAFVCIQKINEKSTISNYSLEKKEISVQKLEIKKEETRESNTNLEKEKKRCTEQLSLEEYKKFRKLLVEMKQTKQ